MVVSWLRKRMARSPSTHIAKPTADSTSGTYTARELAANNGRGGRPCWVALNGNVYDVTSFLESHPGGADAISEHGGRAIDDVFDAEHRHTAFARNVLDEYRIGVLAEERSARGQLARRNTGFVSTVDLAAMGARKYDSRPADIGAAVAQGNRADRPGAAGGFEEREEEEWGDSSMHASMAARRDDAFIDFGRPLVPQLLRNTWTKEYYLEQIHIPRHRAESPRFFASSFLNAFTMMVWWVVPLFWAPVIACALFYAVRSGLTVLSAARHFAAGAFLWTAYEYVFHRFVFHAVSTLPNSRLLFALHFTMHGVHHLVPMDRYRLVMPPVLMIVLATPVTLALRYAAGLPWDRVAAMQAGSLAGYVAYDMLHYAFHHARIAPGSVLARVKTIHMDHHYVDPNKGFGVSSPLWDVVFGTGFGTKSTY